jgi:hypothetical protein
MNEETEIIKKLQNGELLIVNPRRKNGLILIKKYYAEFAGPGAAIGSCFDRDLETIIFLGSLSLIRPQTPEDRKKGYLIRRQWIRFMKQITDNPVADQRAQVILNQFKFLFDAQTTLNVPDEAFASLVGVLPQTIQKAKQEI